MAKSEDDEEKEVTVLDIKQNLNVYSLKKLRKLANIFIDSLCDLTTEKDYLCDSLDIFQIEKTTLNAQISEFEEKIALISTENIDQRKVEENSRVYVKREEWVQ